jgi:DegV family protein with EDD domain
LKGYILMKIVTDSSADRITLGGVSIATAPLKIITDEKEYLDDINLDVEDMVEALLKYSGKSSTSCPNPEDWLNSFGDEKEIICITITSELSGSYNAACIAKDIYEEKYPDRKVFVFNSLSTGPEMKLLIEKIAELYLNGNSFEDICKEFSEYSKSTALIFMLESMRNLANNGRVSKLASRAAGILGIRAVGKASNKGDLELLDKCRGQEKAIYSIIKTMKELGYSGGKVRIANCLNQIGAQKLKELILTDFKNADIEIYSCGGLCSFYAEKGGLLIGLEK